MKMFLLITMICSFTALAAGKQIKVSVKGMVCGFCAQGITKTFKDEKAVSNVDVSLEKKSVTIDLKEGQALTDEKIQSILEDAGYTVEKIDRR